MDKKTRQMSKKYEGNSFFDDIFPSLDSDKKVSNERVAKLIETHLQKAEFPADVGKQFDTCT